MATWYNCASPNWWTSWIIIVLAFWMSRPLSTIFVHIRILVSPRAKFSMVSSSCFEYCWKTNKKNIEILSEPRLFIAKTKIRWKNNGNLWTLSYLHELSIHNATRKRIIQASPVMEKACRYEWQTFKVYKNVDVKTEHIIKHSFLI